MLTYQCSVCFYSCDLNLEVIENFQANKTVQLVVFHTAKVYTIRPWKFPEISAGIFGRLEIKASLEINVINMLCVSLLLFKTDRFYTRQRGIYLFHFNQKKTLQGSKKALEDV